MYSKFSRDESLRTYEKSGTEKRFSGRKKADWDSRNLVMQPTQFI